MYLNNYFKCKWFKCSNQKTYSDSMDIKRGPLHMLSTRDLLQIKRHTQTESKGMKEDSL